MQMQAAVKGALIPHNISGRLLIARHRSYEWMRENSKRFREIENADQSILSIILVFETRKGGERVVVGQEEELSTFGKISGFRSI